MHTIDTYFKLSVTHSRLRVLVEYGRHSPFFKVAVEPKFVGPRLVR